MPVTQEALLGMRSRSGPDVEAGVTCTLNRRGRYRRASASGITLDAGAGDRELASANSIAAGIADRLPCRVFLYRAGEAIEPAGLEALLALGRPMLPRDMTGLAATAWIAAHANREEPRGANRYVDFWLPNRPDEIAQALIDELRRSRSGLRVAISTSSEDWRARRARAGLSAVRRNLEVPRAYSMVCISRCFTEHK